MAAGGGAEAALGKYLAMLEAATGPAMVKAALTKATADKALFVFGELLDHPKVSLLSGSADAGWLRVLEIFAYDTYVEYKAERERLPALSEKQEAKLRQLSFVSLAASRREVSLEEVARALDLASVRAAEEVVIASLNAGVVEGKIDQRLAVVEVEGAMGRDVRPSSLGAVGAKLGQWRSRAEEAIRALEGAVQRASVRAERAKTDADAIVKAHEAVVASVKADEKSAPPASSSSSSFGGSAHHRVGDMDDFASSRRGGVEFGGEERRGPSARPGGGGRRAHY